MGVARKDHIDPGHAARHRLVHIKAVMRQADDQFGAHAAHFVNHFLHPLITDPERVFGEHPAGVGDGHIGEGLTDHGDLDAAAFKELVGLEVFGWFIPFGVKDVLAKGREGQIAHDVAHAIRPKREFPVKRHRIGPEHVHDVDHVLPLGLVTGVGPVPGIAAIQQQSIGAGGANLVHDSRHTVHAAHLAIASREGGKIVISQGVMRRAAVVYSIGTAEIRACDMGHGALVDAHAKVDFGFPEIDWFQLCVNIGDMDQRHISKGLKLQQLVLRQRLLRSQTAPVAKPGRADNCAGSYAGL